MRIVIFALLFQFVSPAFFTVVTQGQGTELGADDQDTLHGHHSSIIVPQLLKEKEESETNDNDLIIEFVALIDFTHHSSVLTKSHESKLTPFAFHDRIDHQPPLFTLYCVYTI